MNQLDNTCNVNASAADIMTTITSLMTYNNDGESYSHNFTVNKAGAISIFIYANDSSYIQAIYYINRDWTGPGTAERWSNFNLPRNINSDLAGGITVNFSYTFETYLEGPTTGTVDFDLEFDDGIQITIDGQIQPFVHDGGATVNNNFYDAKSNTGNFSFNMNKYQLYRLQVRWNNAGGDDWFLWYWNYTGQARTIIPAIYFYYPHYTGPSIINSLCPTGYSPNASYDCVEI